MDTKYLIVGGGMTAAAAVRGIREHDADGSITLVGSEPDPPYKRPPLTKGLWAGERRGEDLEHDGRRRAPSSNSGAGSSRSISPPAARPTIEAAEYGYERLLLATGGTPRRLGGADDQVIYFRTLDDYRPLRGSIADRSGHVIVIGGGFIGSELAASLTAAGARVTMVFPSAGVSSRVLPDGLAEFVTGYYREKGVEVLADETVAAVEGTRRSHRLRAHTRGGCGRRRARHRAERRARRGGRSLGRQRHPGRRIRTRRRPRRRFRCG